MDRELLRLRGGYSAGQATNFLDLDLALNLFLVNVVDRLIGYDERALLRPIKHVCLLDLVCKEQFLPGKQIHTALVLLKANKVFHWKRLQGNGRCVNHLK